MKKRLFFIVVFSILTFMITCSSDGEVKDDQKSANKNNTDNQQVKTGLKPDWVINFPSSNDYYIGIGNGSSLQQSQDAAVNMLVSQIRVRVRSEINDFLKETNGVTEEEITQSIKMTVKESVEDLEFVEAYQTPEGQFWSYYRLNIAEYKRKQQEKMEAAKNNALDFLTKSDSANDPGLALKYALLGYFHISKYVTQALRVDYAGKSVILINEITARIQSILNNFRFEVLKNNISIEKISPQSVDVPFAITVNQQPVKNFPVIFYNNKGKLD
ncbi:MAG: LPP20 family lipoprotein, partial [Spirochaetes bacterium]|nr:LPP20 family lipoprotein [Spirochaetota bacterium]